jgi:hypothetical protein
VALDFGSKTRRDFVTATNRDGLCFWNGSKIAVSVKNLYKTLAKYNFRLCNYPDNAPLPHHAGSSVGHAKGFSGLPEKWLQKLSNQPADKTAGMCFQEAKERDGKCCFPYQ